MSEELNMCDACIHYDDTIDPCDPEAIPNEPCPHCTQYIRSGDDATNQWTPKAASRAIQCPLRWTKEPPKEPGWYWLRCFEQSASIINVACDLTEYEAKPHIEWAGPIPEPEGEGDDY